MQVRRAASLPSGRTNCSAPSAAHISEEVKKAAIAAPVAIFVAVVGTGALGWVLNVVMVLCSGDIADLPGISGSAFLTIMANRMGKTGALILWPFVCLVAFFTVQTATQACARTFYAFRYVLRNASLSNL